MGIFALITSLTLYYSEKVLITLQKLYDSSYIST